MKDPIRDVATPFRSHRWVRPSSITEGGRFVDTEQSGRQPIRQHRPTYVVGKRVRVAEMYDPIVDDEADLVDWLGMVISDRRLDGYHPHAVNFAFNVRGSKATNITPRR